MQTATERRYIEIYAEIIRSGQSAEQTAERLGVAAVTAHRAVRWARDRGLHLLDTKDKLREHLNELGALLHRLERAFTVMERRYRQLLRKERPRRQPAEPEGAEPEAAAGAPPAPVRGPRDSGARASIRIMALLAERILSIRTRVMELEGIYKHVLNIQHGGEIKVRSEPDLSRLSDAELNQLEQLTRRTIASNN